MLAGLGAVAMTYLLALRVAGTVLPERCAIWTAGLAAALLALSGLAVQTSDTIMADAPALWWVTAAIWLWTAPWAAGRTRRSRLAGFASGLCFALAVSTRFECAPLLASMAVYWWACRAHGVAPSALAWIVGAVLAALPQALYTLRYSDPVLHQQWLTTWNPVNFWQSGFATQDGVQHYAISAGAFYLLHPLYSPQSLPFLLAPFLPICIVALWRGRSGDVDGSSNRAASRAYDLQLLAWWLIPALYLAGVPFESARFAVIYVPPLAILEAIGLAAVVVRLPSRARGLSRLGVALALLSLCLLAADSRRPLAALANGKARDLSAVRWLTTHAPRGATIAAFSLTLTLYHDGDTRAHDWTLADLSAVTSADLDRLSRLPHLVTVADEVNLAAQWPGLAPERSLLRLVSHARLRPVAYVGGYTIRER